MLNKIKKIIIVALLGTAISCGTIMKPYQINQPNSGQLDATIVLLDSLGLVLFIFPGIIALTVDYSNGTLFLPRSK